MTEPPQPTDVGRPAGQEPQHGPSLPPQGSPGPPAQPGPAQPPGWAVRAAWTPAQKAGNKLKDACGQANAVGPVPQHSRFGRI
jgi:hypothetical protein